MSGHNHDHGPSSGGDLVTHRGRLLLVLALTSIVLIVEVIGAVITGSLALLADAGHMLTDVAGLVMALITATLMTRPASPTRTWGWRRAEILGATAQAAVLFAVGVFVLVEGIRRLFEPPDVASGLMIVFGVVGLLANAVGILVLIGNRNANLNLRAAFLEVLNDTLGSVAVIAAALAIAITGWEQADALASILIALLILPRAYRLLREAVDILLEATPRDLDLPKVRQHILDLPHVHAVHDLHASQIATGLPVLTAHVVVDDEWLVCQVPVSRATRSSSAAGSPTSCTASTSGLAAVMVAARTVSFASYAAWFFGPNWPPGRYRFSRFHVPITTMPHPHASARPYPGSRCTPARAN